MRMRSVPTAWQYAQLAGLLSPPSVQLSRMDDCIDLLEVKTDRLEALERRKRHTRPGWYDATCSI